MNYKNATKILDQILINASDPTCVLLDGQWGIGKTYTLTQWALDNENSYEFKSISVFGKTDIKEIEKGIVIQILQDSFNKRFSKIIRKKNKGNKKKASITLFGNIVKSGIGSLSQALIGNDITTWKLIDNITIESLGYKRSRETKRIIVCLDDIERASSEINMKQFLGLIDRIKSKFDVILVGNLGQLSDIALFNEYKEKVIDYHLTIDEPHHEALNIIAFNYLVNCNEDMLKSVVEAYTDNSGLVIDFSSNSIVKKNTTTELMNLRIFKKYIELVSRVQLVAKELLNGKEFELDHNILTGCRDVVYHYYRPLKNKNESNEDHKTNYDRNNILNIIECIFLYKDFDKRKLIEYFDYLSEINKDINTLNRIYELDEKRLEEIIIKVQNKIKKRDNEYFKTQNNVVSMYDIINTLECFNDYEEDLLDIAIEMINIDMNSKPLLINHEDYIEVMTFDWHPCSLKTLSFINEVNKSNKRKYYEKLREACEIALNEKDFKKINSIISKVTITKKETFDEIFKTCFIALDKTFDAEIWNVLCNMVSNTDTELLIEYFDNLGPVNGIIKKKRYEWLKELIREKRYIEEWEKENKEDEH